MKRTVRLRYWWVLLPMLAILALTYWLERQTDSEPVRIDGKLRHDPDSIMENFSATKLNAQGEVHFVLSAKRLLHYPDDDSTELEVPRIAVLAPERAPMHIYAKRGTVTQEGNDVFFYDDIEVLREAVGGRSELRVQTDFLHVMPDANLVKTDRQVKMTNGPSTLQATGLVMDNNQRTVTLLSNVRTEYVPNRP